MIRNKFGLISTFTAKTDEVKIQCVVPSSNGSYYACSTEHLLTINSSQIIQLKGFSYRSIAYSNDPLLVFCLAQDGLSVTVYSAAIFKLSPIFTKFRLQKRARRICLNEKSRLLVCVGVDAIQLYDFEMKFISCINLAPLGSHPIPIHVDPLSQSLYVIGADNNLYRFSFNGDLISQRSFERNVGIFAFAPNVILVSEGSYDYIIFDYELNETKRFFITDDAFIFCEFVSKDILFLVHENMQVYIFNLIMGRLFDLTNLSVFPDFLSVSNEDVLMVYGRKVYFHKLNINWTFIEESDQIFEFGRLGETIVGCGNRKIFLFEEEKKSVEFLKTTEFQCYSDKISFLTKERHITILDKNLQKMYSSDFEAVAFCIGNIPEDPNSVIISSNSDGKLTVINSDTFDFVKIFKIQAENLKKIYFDTDSSCLITVSDFNISFFDLITNSRYDDIKFAQNIEASSYGDGILALAHSDRSVSSFSIDMEKKKFHRNWMVVIGKPIRYVKVDCGFVITVSRMSCFLTNKDKETIGFDLTSNITSAIFLNTTSLDLMISADFNLFKISKEQFSSILPKICPPRPMTESGRQLQHFSRARTASLAILDDIPSIRSTLPQIEAQRIVPPQTPRLIPQSGARISVPSNKRSYASPRTKFLKLRDLDDPP